MGSVTAQIVKDFRAYWLAFIVYWGIILFGYDTGIAGGVVSAPYFREQFGLLNADKSLNKKKSDDISANVVSVLQAGAFFGSLGSAPISATPFDIFRRARTSCLINIPCVSAKIGRIRTLLVFAIIFCVGAILTTVANAGSKGLGEIYGGRVISGVGIGGISAVAPTYVSECARKEVRGRITGMFQIMVAIGVMLSYFINLGIGLHFANSAMIWRFPFGFQLVPAGILVFGLLTVKESPRWLASVNRHQEALANLAYLRKDSVDSEAVIHEMAEIDAQIAEEREARKGLGVKEAFFGKGNFIRFVIAFTIFFLQQWAGQNTVGYYAPQIFSSIGYTGTKQSLLASGVYGIVKVVATTIFIFFGVETLGRRWPLFVSAMGMGTLFFIIGAILKTHPPLTTSAAQAARNPPPASKAMAGMLYIYVTFYSMGWGPLPWVYVADIFPTRTRHYGLALASASQWLWNFVVSRVSPNLQTQLGYKMFLMFATINIGAMATFALAIPETKGRSLEEMDVIFGSVSKEQREADINNQERVLGQSEKNANTDQERSMDGKF